MYTWDHKSSQSIWSSLRALAILNDEVQVFKMLISVHKILQEGHPIVLREAQAQGQWLDSCARLHEQGVRGYGQLIQAYVSFLHAKLRFHRAHKEFNGLFEYEEYISLKNIDNPDEGYETIIELMNLQDRIDKLQRLIFSTLRGRANECQISALVPMVKESYGIYKFLTSMLRAMHRRTDAMDALEPLRGRYNAQHHELRRFYFECASLKFLTSLINVPKLNAEPPSLLAPPPDVPELPPREAPAAAPPPRAATPPAPEPTQAEIDEQARMLKEFEDKQRALKEREAAEAERQRREAEEREREFARRQAEQAEQQSLAQAQLLRSQEMNHIHGRVAELERDLLYMRGQYERDQLLLHQYDARVKSLEMELGNAGQHLHAQLASKDERLLQLEEQVDQWRKKYEALAKLYSQLRQEHLDLLSKLKQTQLKAGSAQEAINKMERMEREMKAKNVAMSDMIRERDRARLELDRVRGGELEEVERLKRELRFAEERAEDAIQARGDEVSSVMARMNAQITELEEALSAQKALVESKDAEALILQEGMDATIRQMNEMRLDQGTSSQALDAQIDTIILDHSQKLNAIFDSIFQSCADKMDDALYELESPAALQDAPSTTKSAATPEYVLSLIEKTQSSSNEFAAALALFAEQQAGGDHVSVIQAANQLAQAACDSLLSFKSALRFSKDEEAVERLTAVGAEAGGAVLRFFLHVQSFRLAGLSAAQRRNVAMQQSAHATQAWGRLSDATQGLIAAGAHARPQGDLGDLVEREMLTAASTIEAATQRLQTLLSRDKAGSRYSATELQVHDTILEAALAVMRAIGGLVRAATESQEEIVAQGKGTSSAQQFYKKNNRWTEGLISAARAVAYASTLLIEAADGVISGTHSLEQLIVASNEVSAATVQLVAASRVKSEFMSKTQDRLERAAKAVTEACRALVKQVRMISDRQESRDDTDYARMPTHEFKVREMEQQVEVLKLERELMQARRVLGAMRRAGYHATEDD